MPMKKYTSRPSRSVKRSRATRSKTPARRYSRFPLRTLAIAAPGVGLGASATTVLRTSFFANVNTAATGIFTGFLKPGSAFDPTGDISAVQPALFDQFAAIYQRYKVNNCSIKITVTGKDATASRAWVMASYPSVDSTALGTYQGAATQPLAKTISGGYQVAGVFGIGASPKQVWHKLNHDAIVGVKSDAYDSGALVTADPTANQYMVLPMFIQASNNEVTGYVLEIDMWQNVTFSQRKNVVDA